ncbi:SGNH/GDSL hydrolase family protein [Methylobacterium organophilum]|uniref:SGNH/GDSL hydrolase family protein n=1 Tax=Methylobacterium organophilum TaxID=410 RepID=UPI001F13F996|nr:SGNH/GDSL hydrolase family protein [Methylobacterium organophilum]UMY19157.1 SGNH/GDSL hydrolase family protein [Methylobacterium organophilum]
MIPLKAALDSMPSWRRWRAHARARRELHLVVERHIAQRLRAINAELATMTPGTLLLAGNSHAECLGPFLTGLPVVNVGIGGTFAPGYAEQLPHLTCQVRAGVAVLFLGSNDILRREKPLSPRSERRFDAAVIQTLTWLRDRAEVVLVAAVPPLGETAALHRDPAAVLAYTARLGQLAEANGGHVFDPFTALRAGDSGLSITDAMAEDGVHLRDYAPLAQNVLQAVLAAATLGLFIAVIASHVLWSSSGCGAQTWRNPVTGQDEAISGARLNLKDIPVCQEERSTIWRCKNPPHALGI